MDINDVLERNENKIVLYHATAKHNVFSIMSEGLKPGVDGLVYFCANVDDACWYAMIHNVDPVAIIRVELTPEEMDGTKINPDNNPDVTPLALGYEGSIPKEKIPQHLWEIPLYTFSEPVDDIPDDEIDDLLNDIDNLTINN